MAQPLYFLPGLSREVFAPGDVPAPEILRERGLVAAFSSMRNLRTEGYSANISKGPGGQSGFILTYQLPNGRIPDLTDYRPDQQAWVEVLEGKLWIGYDTAQPPTPAELQRPRISGGYLLEMSLGEWQIPIVRRENRSTNLPCDLYLERGNLVEHIKGTYRELWDRMAVVAAWFFEGRFDQYDKRQAFELSVDVLGINYRFGIYEQTALRVIDTESLPSILALAVDVPGAKGLEEAQKKSASSSPPASTTPGPPAD